MSIGGILFGINNKNVIKWWKYLHSSAIIVFLLKEFSSLLLFLLNVCSHILADTFIYYLTYDKLNYFESSLSCLTLSSAGRNSFLTKNANKGNSPFLDFMKGRYEKSIIDFSRFKDYAPNIQ